MVLSDTKFRLFAIRLRPLAAIYCFAVGYEVGLKLVWNYLQKRGISAGVEVKTMAKKFLFPISRIVGPKSEFVWNVCSHFTHHFNTGFHYFGLQLDIGLTSDHNNLCRQLTIDFYFYLILFNNSKLFWIRSSEYVNQSVLSAGLRLTAMCSYKISIDY